MNPIVRYVQARLVGSASGVKQFAYACGKTLCDLAKFEARLVDSATGTKHFAFLSECRHPEAWVALNFLTVGCNPYPLSDRLRIIFGVNSPSGPGMACWLTACPRTDLVWDGSLWAGTIPMA